MMEQALLVVAMILTGFVIAKVDSAFRRADEILREIEEVRLCREIEEVRLWRSEAEAFGVIITDDR